MTFVTLKDIPARGPRRCAGCGQPLGDEHLPNCSLVEYRGGIHNDEKGVADGT